MLDLIVKRGAGGLKLVRERSLKQEREKVALVVRLRDAYWISGPLRDGKDVLYATYSTSA